MNDLIDKFYNKSNRNFSKYLIYIVYIRYIFVIFGLGKDIDTQINVYKVNFAQIKVLPEFFYWLEFMKKFIKLNLTIKIVVETKII